MRRTGKEEGMGGGGRGKQGEGGGRGGWWWCNVGNAVNACSDELKQVGAHRELATKRRQFAATKLKAVRHAYSWGWMEHRQRATRYLRISPTDISSSRGRTKLGRQAWICVRADTLPSTSSNCHTQSGNDAFMPHTCHHRARGEGDEGTRQGGGQRKETPKCS